MWSVYSLICGAGLVVHGAIDHSILFAAWGAGLVGANLMLLLAMKVRP